jgi:uncharacterized protein (DUF305 family)
LSAAQQQQPSQASQQCTAAMDRMQSDVKKDMEADPTKTWVKMAIPHHQELIDMSEIVLRNTKDPKIRRWLRRASRCRRRTSRSFRAGWRITGG